MSLHLVSKQNFVTKYNTKIWYSLIMMIVQPVDRSHFLNTNIKTMITASCGFHLILYTNGRLYSGAVWAIERQRWDSVAFLQHATSQVDMGGELILCNMRRQGVNDAFFTQPLACGKSVISNSHSIITDLRP